MSRDYKTQSFQGLYDTIQDLILDYSFDRKQRHLTDIFNIVSFLSSEIMRIFHGKSFSDPVLRDYVVSAVAEAVVLKVWRDPWHLLKHDDLTGYLRVSVLNAVRRYAPTQERGQTIVNGYDLDTHEGLEVLLGAMPMPDQGLRKQDEARYVVRAVAQSLRTTARFRDRWEGLVWPLVQALVSRSDVLFESLSYPDRVALRMVLIRCEALMSEQAQNVPMPVVAPASPN